MLIGLTGLKGSGKDTVASIANIICNEHEIPFARAAFADPIKRAIVETFKLKSIAEYDKFKESAVLVETDSLQRFVEGRHIVQSIGMLMRSYDEEQFTRYVEGQLLDNHRNFGLSMATDVRFPNEVSWIRKHRGLIFKVINPRKQKTEAAVDHHVTELGVEQYDYVIDNAGTIQDLHHAVRVALGPMYRNGKVK